MQELKYYEPSAEQREILETPNVDDVTILHGDCMERMKEIPDGSVSLIATDPPYFRVKDEAWDRQWKDRESFLTWIGELCNEWHRILKPNGSLYVFASPGMAWGVEREIGKRFEVLNRITWRKEYGWAKRLCKEEQRAFFPASEAIIFAEHFGADNHAKGEAGYEAKCDELHGFLFEPLRAYLDGERKKIGVSSLHFDSILGTNGLAKKYFNVCQWQLPTAIGYAAFRSAFPGYFRREYEDLHREYEDLRREYEDLRREYEDLRREYEDLRRPFSVSADVPYTDVWDFPTVSDRPGKHPCEKPLAMIEHIVSASSRSGDLVLDCFAGSGVTGQACRNLGRRCILIEKDPHWTKMARIWMDRPHAYIPREGRKPLKSAETPLFQGF